MRIRDRDGQGWQPCTQDSKAHGVKGPGASTGQEKTGGHPNQVKPLVQGEQHACGHGIAAEQAAEVEQDERVGAEAEAQESGTEHRIPERIPMPLRVEIEDRERLGLGLKAYRIIAPRLPK